MITFSDRSFLINSVPMGEGEHQVALIETTNQKDHECLWYVITTEENMRRSLAAAHAALAQLHVNSLFPVTEDHVG